MALILGTVLHAAFLGAIVGFVWSLALKSALTSGLIVGLLAGVVLGLLLGLMGKAASLGGRITHSEGMYANGMFMMLIAMLAGAAGIVVWIVRAILF